MIVVIGDRCSSAANGFARQGNVVVAYLPEDAANESFSPPVVVARTIGGLIEAAASRACLDDPKIVCCKAKESSISDEHFASIAENVMLACTTKLRGEHTVSLFLQQWEMNAIRNLPLLSTLNVLSDLSFPGAPAIVAAPGPSLSKNIDRLRLAKGKAVIIALQRAARQLVDAGVIPDAIVALDPNPLVAGHFDGLPPEAMGLLVLEHSVAPEVYSLPAGKILRYEGRDGVLEWVGTVLGRVAHIAGGATAVSAAVGVAMTWGCRDIALAGVDLAYNGNERYSGWPTNKVNDVQFSLRGYYGGTVRTAGDLLDTHRFLSCVAAFHDDYRFFNCTEGGAFIDNMRHIPLAEFINGLTGQVDVRGAIERLPAPCAEGARDRAAGIKLNNKASQVELDRVLSDWRH